MSSKPVLHGFPVSPNVRSARVALHEKALDHRFEEIGLDRLATPEYAAINPFRLMPALTLAEGVLYETPAILTWADAAGAGARLQPTDPFQVGKVWKFVGIAQNQLYRVGVMQLYFHRVLAGVFGMTPDTGAADAAVAPTLKALDVVEAELEEGFLAGRAFSLADIYCGTMVDYVARTGDGATALGSRPKTKRWLDALRARPSFRATFAPMLAGTDQA